MYAYVIGGYTWLHYIEVHPASYNCKRLLIIHNESAVGCYRLISGIELASRHVVARIIDEG